MARYLNPDNPDNHVFFDAFTFACELHSGQMRKSGAPYISHPCAVAEILARELGFKDPFLLAASLLHDVVEDVPTISSEDIEDRFGVLISELVDGCTKLARFQLDKATLKDLTHSKIFLSASRRLGVLIIKLADRLHNLRTLHFLTQAKRQRIAQETVEIYAPIAARLNVFPLKRELYHLALSYLYPRKSKKILQHIRDVRSSPQVLEIEDNLKRIFDNAGLLAVIRPRPKGLGSYYDPVKRTLDISNPENWLDFAVVLQSEEVLKCYTALGIINSSFPPLPRSLRDFIATPKNNGYQSIHVRVHWKGQNYLIKIRTPEMDEWAAFGIIGAWDAHAPLSDEHWLEVSELLRSIGEYGGAAPQRKALIRLSEGDEIFVYSPKGDVYYLPKGSVVLDFAYRIHSDLGDRCDGAVVNGEWAPPTRALKDGDSVKVVVSTETPEVDPDLEILCKTPRARTAINRRLQQKRLEYAEGVGRQILFQELRRCGLSEEVLQGERVRLVFEFLNLKDVAELFVKVGQDLLSPKVVLYYLEAAEYAQQMQPKGPCPPGHNTLDVAAPDKSVHKFARCCNPWPGQDGVVATVSERGATFHHRDCTDIFDRHELEPQQLLQIRWQSDVPWPHPQVFRLVVQESLQSLIGSPARFPGAGRILSLSNATDKNDQLFTLMTVVLKDFSESREFFGALAPYYRIVIEDYGREGGLMRLHAQDSRCEVPADDSH